MFIVTDWYKIAKAIIKTSKVEQIPYKDISEEYAAIEGEGDKSLKEWRETHWAYYSREMEESDEKPTEDMLIVCEQFETIWK
ncbi:MAG: ASCH domain-containing protein [Flavobacteriales bacterium]|nr:ASCH domain-containing protein [Flavobacteriales bacterium]